MTKIGTFDAMWGRVGGFVNMVNIIRCIIQHMDSFLFNIINIIGSKLVGIMSVGKLSHSAPYTQNP